MFVACSASRLAPRCISSPSITRSRIKFAFQPRSPNLMSSSSRPPSRLEEHLESITERVEPTLQDLERFKPDSLQLLRRTDLAAYKSLYNDTALAMSRSFTRSQMARMLDQLLPERSASPLRKRDMIKLILGQHWEMPHPAEEERRRKDLVEVRTRAIPVLSAELFLLLGKDGAEFKDMAAKFRVRLYVNHFPLGIRAEGLEPDLIDLAKYIDEFKLNIFSEEMQVNADRFLPDNLMQSISRLAGALVENPKVGMIRITANDHRKASAARRLIVKASMEEILSHRSPSFAHTSSSNESHAPGYPPSYALYPYVPSSPLPWTMGASTGFRPRRVGEWVLGHKIGPVHGLNGEGSVITTDGSTVLDLRIPLLDSGLASSSIGLISITASSGHVIMTKPSSSRTTGLVPPIAPSWSFHKALDWLQEKQGRATFVPSLPPPLLESSSSYDTEFVRLRYRRIPSVNGHPTMDLPTSPLVINVLICELSLSPLFTQPIEGNISDQLSALINIRLGNEARLDLILPERPMDLQFLASNLRTLDIDAIPRPLHQFFKDLVQYLLTDDAAVSTGPQPMPPTTISLHDISYELECTLDVRRRVHQLGNISMASLPSGGDWPELSNVQKRPDAVEGSSLVPVTCEYTLDLESKDGRSACLVDCQDPRNDVLWNEFLHRCDQLSLHTYPVIPAGQRAPALSSTGAMA